MLRKEVLNHRMKGKVLGGCLIVVLLSASLAAGCSGSGKITTTTSSATLPVSSGAQTTTAAPLNTNVPTPELLAKENYVLPNIPRITAEELKALYDQPNIVYSLVDVRLKTDYDDTHIRGARNIANSGKDVVDTATVTALAQLRKDVPLVLYCD